MVGYLVCEHNSGNWYVYERVIVGAKIRGVVVSFESVRALFGPGGKHWVLLGM